MSGRDGEAVLDGVFSAQLARAMKGLQEAGAKYVFLPSERTPGKDPLALSVPGTGRRHALMLTAPPSSVRNPGTTTSTLWPCE